MRHDDCFRSPSAACASSPRSSAPSSCSSARANIMGALYKGLIGTGGAVAHRRGLVGDSRADRLRPRCTERRHGDPRRPLFSCGIVGLAVTGADRGSPSTTPAPISPGEVDRQGLGHRPRHQRHPGSRDSLESTALPALVIIVGIMVSLSSSPACSASPSR